jgi:hypothetical protein
MLFVKLTHVPTLSYARQFAEFFIKNIELPG